jgi:hypothetical protein
MGQLRLRYPASAPLGRNPLSDRNELLHGSSACAAHGPAFAEAAEQELHTRRPSQKPLPLTQEATDMRLFLVLPEGRLILVKLVEDPDA